MKFLLFLFVSVSVISAQDYKNQLNQIVNNSFYDRASISVYVYDLKEDKVLYGYNSRKLMHPASNMKLLTAITALVNLEDDYTFNTAFYYTGNISGSTLNGDVYAVGRGDPDFTSGDLDSLILRLRESGITKINGSLYGDISYMDSLYWGAGWMWDDQPSGNAPYLSPLIIDDASVKIYYKPSFSGNPADVDYKPKSNYFNFVNNSVTISEDTSALEISRDWFHNKNDIEVKGFLSVNDKPDSTWISMYKPEFFFLTLLKEKLNNSGIEFYGKIDTSVLPVEANEIYTRKRPLNEVLENMLKESDNLSAEMVLRGISKANKPDLKANDKPGIELIEKFLSEAGIDKDEYRIADGSGLSRYNLVSAELIGKALTYFYKNYPKLFGLLYNNLPVTGVDGTLEDRMRNGFAHKNVRAKTGTLNGVTALSGYLTSRNMHDIVFSIISQNNLEQNTLSRRFEDIICEILAGIK